MVQAGTTPNNLAETMPDLPHSADDGNKGENSGDAVEGIKNNHDFGESMKVGGNPVSFQQKRTLPDLPHSADSGNKGENGGDAVEGIKNNHDFADSMKVGGDAISF